jgi:hypothetical protein
MLDFSGSNGVSTLTGAVTIERAPTTPTPYAYTTIASGNAPDIIFWLDVNDGQPGALNNALQYVYRITDSTGQTVTPPVSVGGAITVITNGETALLARLFEAAVNNVTLPHGIVKRPSVSTAMPIVGLPPLPMIVINRELLQQSEVPIGQQTPDVNSDNTLTFGGYAKTMWRVSVLTQDPASRDFWSDATIAIFMSICASVAAPLGKNNSHSFQTAHYQVAKDREVPGFYGADIMLDLEGVLATTIQTNYGLIETITFTTTETDTSTLFNSGLPYNLANIVFQNVPVSAAGLPIGALWSNSGFLCLVGPSTFTPPSTTQNPFGANNQDTVIVGYGNFNYTKNLAVNGLVATGLPSSPTGLPIGAVYLNGSYFCVVDDSTYSPPVTPASYQIIDATGFLFQGLPESSTGLASQSVWVNGDFINTV